MSAPKGLESIRPHVHHLENGLFTAAVELPDLHRAVILAHVRVGSAYEDQRSNGISHFLEHMLFRGTPEHPSAYELASTFEALGGTLEAGTAEDHGVLSISIPPESVEETLDTFCEVLKNPLLDELDVERDIVREEILEGLDEEGQDIDASSRCRRLCFGDHPLGFPIAGTLEALNSFNPKSLGRHHQRHYTGNNLALVVAGPIRAGNVLTSTERKLGALAKGEPPTTPLPKLQQEPRFGFFKHKASQTSLSICYRAHGRDSRLEPATEMLLRILDDGMSTRLYHRICDQLGLCYDAAAGYQAFANVGVVEIAAETAHERAKTLLTELLQITTELALHGPSEQELERARRRSRWQYQAMLDEPEALAHFYAQAHLEGSALSPAERLEQLCAVSCAEVLEAAQATFRPENLSVMAVGLQRGRQLEKLEQLTFSAA